MPHDLPPTNRRASDRWVIGLATLDPLGRLPAPGTWGSLAGVGWVAFVGANVHPIAELGFAATWLAIAVWVCGEAEKRLGRVDPSEVNLDEFAVIPLVFLGLRGVLADSSAWVIYLAGFLLFRLFDITKPFGIRRLQRIHGGLGVVLDDVVAALVACGVLHALVRFTPLLEWVGEG